MRALDSALSRIRCPASHLQGFGGGVLHSTAEFVDFVQRPVFGREGFVNWIFFCPLVVGTDLTGLSGASLHSYLRPNHPRRP
jgi:hypothetical protein